MRVILNSVAAGADGQSLPSTSLTLETGAITVAVAETAKRPTVLSLLAGGRMIPDAGSITLDGETDPGALQAASAIIDAPDISEPVADLRFDAVVQEELMFAGAPSSRRATRETLDELGAAEFGGWTMQNVPPAVRLRVLSELAAARPGIRSLILTSPDRHGGAPSEWWQIAEQFAGRGFAVLVIVGQAAADAVAPALREFEGARLEALEAARAEAARRETLDAASVDSPTSPIDSLAGPVDSLTGPVDSPTSPVDSLTSDTDSLTSHADSFTGPTAPRGAPTGPLNSLTSPKSSVPEERA